MMAATAGGARTGVAGRGLGLTPHRRKRENGRRPPTRGRDVRCPDRLVGGVLVLAGPAPASWCCACWSAWPDRPGPVPGSTARPGTCATPRSTSTRRPGRPCRWPTRSGSRPGSPWPARRCSLPSCPPRRWPRPAATPTAGRAGRGLGREAGHLPGGRRRRGGGRQQHPGPGQAAGRAKVAFQEHPELAAATLDFVERVEDAAGTPPATAPPPQPPPGQEDADGDTVLLVLLAVAGVVALGVLLALTLENRSQRRSIRSSDPVRRGQGGRPGGPGRARRRPAQPQRRPPGRGGGQPAGGQPVHQGVRATWSGPSRRSTRPGRRATSRR